MPNQIHSNGGMRRFQTQHIVDEPYHNYRQSNTTTSQTRGNLSDQKTPTAHPNTFLYRAHLNIDGSTNQQDDTDAADQYAALQKKLPNVSSFYQDDLVHDNGQEEKKESESMSLRMS